MLLFHLLVSNFKTLFGQITVIFNSFLLIFLCFVLFAILFTLKLVVLIHYQVICYLQLWRAWVLIGRIIRFTWLLFRKCYVVVSFWGWIFNTKGKSCLAMCFRQSLVFRDCQWSILPYHLCSIRIPVAI